MFRLADAPFSTDELVALITTPATGAACVFSGMVRGATVGKSATEFLEYEGIFADGRCQNAAGCC